jgi:hypothetical protein
MAGTTGAAGAPVTPQPTAAGTIVPLYTSPSHASWAAVIAAKQAHPTVEVIAVVNPSNGPHTAVSAAYTDGIAKLIAAKIRVVGYVYTEYGDRAPAEVEADIGRWKSFYPTVTGIFFDEQSNDAEDVPYYRRLADYAKGQSLGFTIGNPGADSAKEYVGVLSTMLIYESGGLPAVTRLAGWHAEHAPSNFGVIPYATSLDLNFVKEARKYVRYVYLQNDNLPNPWDSVPPYFDQLLAALE